MEVSEALGDEEYRWALDGEMRLLLTFWEILTPCYYKPVPGKRHSIVPVAVTKVTMLDLFL